MRAFLPTLALACTLAAAPSPQAVRVVDGVGALSNTYIEIQPAINQSNPGDLVVVRPGTYGRITLDGKPLTIVADTALGPVVLSGSLALGGNLIDVRNLPTGSAAAVLGFEADGLTFVAPFVAPYGLEASANDGVLFVQDVVVRTALFTGAAVVDDCEAVSIVTSEIDGIESIGYASFGFEDAGRGLRSTDSEVFVYESVVRGGEGAEGDAFEFPEDPGDPGFAGWRLEGGFGLAVHSTFEGGMGGPPGGQGPCADGAPGGPGLQLAPSASDPTLLRTSTTLVGGPGGIVSDEIQCTPGLPGPPLDVQAGAITTDDHALRALRTERLVGVGDTKTDTFVGEPGDLVWHLFGLVPASDPTYVPALGGPVFVGTPSFLRLRGVVPASGELDFAVTVPDPGIAFFTLYEQAFFYDGLRFYASNPRVSVVLADESPPPPPPNDAPTCAFEVVGLFPTGHVAVLDAATSSDPDGTIVLNEWDFGDGQSSSSTTSDTVHLYPAAGTYTVTLTVTDDDGAASSCSMDVDVP